VSRTSSKLLLAGLWFADNVDKAALLLVFLFGVLSRVATDRPAASPPHLPFALYLAFWYTTLDSLDKFAGYGDGERWRACWLVAGMGVIASWVPGR